MHKIIYKKPPLTIKDQINLLETRGVLFDDKAFAEKCLENISYYRFSGYLYIFRDKNLTQSACITQYRSGTSFSNVYRLYRFDRKLRFLLIDAIERFEISIKALIVNQFTLKYGAFGHKNESNFNIPDKKRKDWESLWENINKEICKSKESFISHYINRYDDSVGFPLWHIMEIMTLGDVGYFFEFMNSKDRKDIAKTFGIPPDILHNWLLSIRYIRNVCSHHSRVWNRKLSNRPQMPKNIPSFHEEGFEIDETRIYSILTILKYLLAIISPQCEWKNRFYELLKDFSDVPQYQMGIPKGFENSEAWK